MSKLENVSVNLKEILCAIADGKEVQYWSDLDRKWQILHDLAFGFALDEDGMKLKWRIKPDAFEEWYEGFYETQATILAYHEVAKAAWDAAMEHKDDEL